MDGKLKWAEVLRSARGDRNLSQRELARLAGVPQPTVAEIESGRREPSLSLVSRIVESVGFELHIELRPASRYSAVSVALRISHVIEGESASQTLDQLDDEVLRILLSFRDAMAKAELPEFQAYVSDPPILVGAAHWDAFLAAAVEDQCASRRLPPPKWVALPQRFVKPFWYLSSNSLLHDWELETAPAAFVRHGVLAAQDELTSV